MVRATALLSLLAVAIIGYTSPIPKAEPPPPADIDSNPYHQSLQWEKAGNYQAAISSLLGLVQEKPQDYFLNLRLGWLSYLAGKHDQAVRYYVMAIEVAPASLEPRLGRMLPVLAQARYAEVEALARECLDLDPLHYTANLRLAFSMRVQGKAAEAEQVDRRMLALYPSDVSLLTELGLCLKAQDRVGEARTVFARILDFDPSNVFARQQLNEEPKR